VKRKTDHQLTDWRHAMTRSKRTSDSKSTSQRKKLTVKRQPVKDLPPSKDKDPKGGLYEQVGTPIEHSRSKT
jgi:hypothetical protein